MVGLVDWNRVSEMDAICEMVACEEFMFCEAGIAKQCHVITYRCFLCPASHSI